MPMPFRGSPDGLDAAPPNPVTDPAAAQESSPIRTMTGGQPPPGATGAPGNANPGGVPQQPDLSGILMLGQKLSEGMITLQQALPAQAGQISQAQALLENALANWMQQQSSSMGAMGGPMSPPPGSVTQAGPQYPGGGFGAGRAF